MTANEMRGLFQLLYNGATYSEMGFDDVEVGRLLTTAQNRIYQEKLFGNRNEYREGLDESSKRDVELYALKDYHEISSFTSSSKFPNAIQANLPENFYISLTERVDITWNGTTYINVGIKVVDEDCVNETLTSPFNKPDRHLILRATGRGVDSTPKVLYLIPDSYTTITKYKTSYIRKPSDIVVNLITSTSAVDCELDSAIHEEIVRRAVEIALGSVGSQKYQIGMNEAKE